MKEVPLRTGLQMENGCPNLNLRTNYLAFKWRFFRGYLMKQSMKPYNPLKSFSYHCSSYASGRLGPGESPFDVSLIFQIGRRSPRCQPEAAHAIEFWALLYTYPWFHGCCTVVFVNRTTMIKLPNIRNSRFLLPNITPMHLTIPMVIIYNVTIMVIPPDNLSKIFSWEFQDLPAISHSSSVILIIIGTSPMGRDY